MKPLIMQIPLIILKRSIITETNEGKRGLLTRTYLIDVDEIPRIL
jgi:hypothetical protein